MSYIHTQTHTHTQGKKKKKDFIHTCIGMLSSCLGSLECSLPPLSIFLSSGYSAHYTNELLAWTDTLFSVSVFVQLFAGGWDRFFNKAQNHLPEEWYCLQWAGPSFIN